MLESEGIEVRDVDSFFAEISQERSMLHEQDSQAVQRPIILGKHIYEALRQNNRNTNANDILRRLILFYYGGIYTDIGFRFERDISPLLGLYDYIFYLYSWQNIDHGLSAIRAQDPIYKKELEFIHSLWRHPQKAEIKALLPDAPEQLMLTGSHSFMNFLDLYAPEDARILCLPAHELTQEQSKNWRITSNGFITLVRGRSWNGLGNLCNNMPIQASQLDILSVVPSKTYCYRWPSENLKAYGTGNIGEYLFSDAARKLVGSQTIATEDIHKLRPEDTYMIVASNVINGSENSGKWAQRISKDLEVLRPDVPAVILCMGAQAADTQTEIRIHPTTLEVLKTIQNRRLYADRINIGVRGTYTQAQLARFGIESEVIGCPSLLYQPIPFDSLKTLRSPSNLAVAATFYGAPEPQLSVIKIAARYNATYFVQTEQKLIEWLKMPPTTDDAMAVIEKASTNPCLLSYEQKNFIKLYKMAAGERYFRDFVQILRENSIVPENSDSWIEHFKNSNGPNFAVSTRIHGTVPALLAGKRALLIAHDSRTAELAQTLSIPSLKSIDANLSIEDLYEIADPKEFIANFPIYAEKIYSFLNKNGVPCLKLDQAI